MENPVLKPLWNSNNVGAGARYDPTRMLELRFSPTPIIRIYRHTLKLGPLGSDHGQVKRDKKRRKNGQIYCWYQFWTILVGCPFISCLLWLHGIMMAALIVR